MRYESYEIDVILWVFRWLRRVPAVVECKNIFLHSTTAAPHAITEVSPVSVVCIMTPVSTSCSLPSALPVSLASTVEPKLSITESALLPEPSKS